MHTRNIGLVLIAFILSLGAQQVYAEDMESGKAATKFTRGAVNIFTGWVEVPKRIHETTQYSGAPSGFTWGLMRGIGYGIVRTAAGLYEFITFPFPAPPNYEPVLTPEYIFTTASSK